ncbi:cysteine desulfurase family protein [Tenuibacillus multivorans]|uniref:cysteine desulfurase n=1 Tax=Tenuibacillus multivorans TaxID=237069 RepID=A0A1G9ZI58_9BACI|nr:cysteine desulfurase family protein [Tenuibacillus multivorans]GEL77492.1 cysteine desulfurase [Tenuibacillus multivorans]SDN20964.1 cysteine desulfurase [Tenuibacillus multivorans]
MKRIYLDHAATTPIHPSVKQTMREAMEESFGNPSSIHHFGRESRKRLDEARATMAKSINTNYESIIFTSGGTEANNLAIFGTAYANQDKGKHIITTQIEHHAVLHPCEQLEKEGFDVTYLPVDENGIIDIMDLKNALRKDTILVTIMFANNETGMKQPIQMIGNMLGKRNITFHTDAVQAYGIEEIDVEQLRIDLLTVSSHKIYGPKGIGFLYKRDGVNLVQRLYGGEQERTWRSGTENTLAIEGFKKAVELLMEERNGRNEHYQQLSERLLQTLDEREVDYNVNGELDSEHHVPNILNLSFSGMDVEMFLTNLDLSGVAVSSGSACTAGSIDPSHVIKAMYGEDSERLRNSIRFSFGKDNNIEDMEQVAERIQSIVNRLASNV